MAFPTTITITTAVTTIAVVTGVGISLFAYRAARRRQSKPLRLFSYGFAAITTGLFLGSLTALVLRWNATRSLFVQSVLVALGFVLLVRSLYVAEPPTELTPP